MKTKMDQNSKISFVKYQAVSQEFGMYPSKAIMARDVLLEAGILLTDDQYRLLAEAEDGNIYYASIGLAGEVGEFCNKVKKVMRDNKGAVTEEFKKDAESECGDILWYLSALVSDLGLSLEGVARKNIEKLQSRKERGVIGGSGDDR